MSKKLIQNGSNIEIFFSLKNENGVLLFGEEEGKKMKFALDSDLPLFDIFKCLIGKEEGYTGKIKVNKGVFNEELEELSIESLPSYLTFNKNTIIQVGSGNKKFGFIKDIKDKKLILEVSKPFKNVTSILNVKILKVE